MPRHTLPSAPSRAAHFRRELLALLRSALGGALLLVVWIALWTVTWAAVAGPLSPVHPLRRADAIERSIAGS